MAISISSNLNFQPGNVQISKHAIVNAAGIVERKLRVLATGVDMGKSRIP